MKTLLLFIFSAIVMPGAFTATYADNRGSEVNTVDQMFYEIVGVSPEAATRFNIQVNPKDLLLMFSTKSVDLRVPSERAFFLESLLPAIKVLNLIENTTLEDATRLGAYEEFLATRELALEVVHAVAELKSCSFVMTLEFQKSSDIGLETMIEHNFGLVGEVGLANANLEEATVEFLIGPSCMRNNNKCCNANSNPVGADSCATETRYCKLITQNGIQKCNGASRHCGD